MGTTRSKLPLIEPPLTELLQSAFGFSQFRPSQEAVVRTVVDGQDVLLVMPTGSGKSLCYQLPGLARGGTTIVISPLIALMEDQVSKLAARGLSVARIHSGRDRQASRQACLDYLAGKLQFLFIAPERLAVSGFPEMLAKRTPSLIAIDEAHCISQWGHDFRPDYRMLGQYLPLLRPAPVIALTATATPEVQSDIEKQLGLVEPARFIQGFRRENIAVEVVEVPPSQRFALLREVLNDPARRPAIIYAPNRRQTEDLAQQLSDLCHTAAYHAGLESKLRASVQEAFLAGRIEIMVATIAFGMGIDKADVRTVVHTALPGSVERYYQEIGRAGRDGLPSRAILMESYADRRTHDFFFEQDYPDVAVLDEIYRHLTSTPIQKAALQKQLPILPELFDKAVEKLWIHGGAVVEYETIARGHARWRPSYTAQGDQKAAQIEAMIRLAHSHRCRMSTLVRHFGDLVDSQSPCGLCDFCAPADCIAQQFRPVNAAERESLARIFRYLRQSGSRSSGKLYAELFPDQKLTRNAFEALLGSLARGGLVELNDEVFEKDGKRIPYTSVRLTIQNSGTPARELFVKVANPAREKRARKKVAAPTTQADTSDPRTLRLEEALRSWRSAEAKKRTVPPYCIFSNQVLRNLAALRPGTNGELLEISGVGKVIVENYGLEILRIVTLTE